MPTPMPIMAPNWVVKEGMSTKADKRLTMMKPGIKPMRAVMMGRPMATTEPNAMRRMNTAATMPSNSELPGSSCSATLATPPPSST